MTAAKAIAALVSAAVTILGAVLSLELAHGTAAKWVTLAIVAAGTLSGAGAVYQIPNTAKPVPPS